jgi:hypothetical protein
MEGGTNGSLTHLAAVMQETGEEFDNHPETLSGQIFATAVTISNAFSG